MKPPLHDSADVMAALVKRFAPPAWALLSQVGNGTGFTISNYADAVAMSLWPSRGLDLHGIEIKVRRSDWLREMKRPQKAEAIGSYCDFWWLAVAPDVVDLAVDATPTPWGLLELKGGRLVQIRAAERNPKPDALDKTLVAAILRRASEDMTPRNSIAAQLQARYAEGVKWGKEVAVTEAKSDTRNLGELKASVAAFEAASGVTIGSYNGERIGRLFALAQALDLAKTSWAIGAARHGLTDAMENLQAAARALDEATKTTPEGT